MAEKTDDGRNMRPPTEAAADLPKTSRQGEAVPEEARRGRDSSSDFQAGEFKRLALTDDEPEASAERLGRPEELAEPPRQKSKEPKEPKELPEPQERPEDAPASPSRPRFLEILETLKTLPERLGRQRLGQEIFPAAWTPAKKGALILAGGVLTALLAFFLIFGLPFRSSAEEEALFDSALDSAWLWVEGAEGAPLPNRPGWLDPLKTGGARAAQLAAGVESFLNQKPDAALESFELAAEGREPDHRLISLQAAANLRLLNYGQGRALYGQALSLAGAEPEKGGLKEAADRLGLALCLFHQLDHEQSLTEAGRAWRIRRELLGPADPKTIAALNVMATSLMALSRSAAAGDLLLEGVALALEDGADASTPVMRDALSILYLAYEAQGRLADLEAMFEPQDPENVEDGEEADGSETGPISETEAAGAAPAGLAPKPDERLAARPGDSGAAPKPSASQAGAERLVASLTDKPGDAEPPVQSTVPAESAESAEPANQSTEGSPEAVSPDDQGAAQEPSTESAPESIPSAPSLPDDLTAESPAPVIDRDQARELRRNLQTLRPDSAVLPALSLTLAGDLIGVSLPPCRRPYPAEHVSELVSLCQMAARGYAAVNELPEAMTILENVVAAGLSALKTKPDLPHKNALIESLSLLASLQEAKGALAEAETSLHEARNLIASLPGDDQRTVTSLVILTLRLADNSLAQNKPPIETEMELVSGLTILNKISPKFAVESNPLSPVLYVKLANLINSMGRSKEAASYRNLANRSLKAAQKAHPQYADALARISAFMENSRRGRPADDSVRYLWKAVLPADRGLKGPGSPEAMRQELAALKFMGRLSEFGPMIEAAVKWSAKTSGAGSPTHRRYQSLQLKYLEESGQTAALVAELDKLILEPGVAAEPERSAVIVAALKYKARALEAAGDAAGALAALNQAKAALAEAPDLNRLLPEVEADIDRLSGEGAQAPSEGEN
ncbi:MAG: hypothetical protein LBJ64_00760 [Deltaproteobacteria bacterium]|jgi:hypothetical protein|nr:hypothetical protein [Deltaproteobacteria bacterium]